MKSFLTYTCRKKNEDALSSPPRFIQLFHIQYSKYRGHIAEYERVRTETCTPQRIECFETECGETFETPLFIENQTLSLTWFYTTQSES